MSTVWFTSDTHFNHKWIIGHRGFETVEAMNETLVERWNDRVKTGDRVYHLGDVSLGNVQGTREILDRLKGTIYLIRGNHESVAENKTNASRFEWIKDYHSLRVGEHKVYLCHYAFRSWNCMHHGSWNLHGHSHGSLEDLQTLKQLDVGTDCHGFAPITFEEVSLRMNFKTFVPVDHHS